eukprot:c8982_g1_i1.p1 GENE.c8982_g1_i1~~c8982_g1_i1.p1  ORF type:complete len:271 (-),score=30.99 c8982_g1_i1:161-886(-)
MEILSVSSSAPSFHLCWGAGSCCRQVNCEQDYQKEFHVPASILLPSKLTFRIAKFIMRLCRSNSNFSLSEPCAVFGCVSRPSLALSCYAKRLEQLMCCSSEHFVVSAILIQRLFLAAPEAFSDLSTHRILGTALVLACKFCEDRPETNTFYASCLGTDVKDLNLMERYFLHLIEFRVFVSLSQFQQAAAFLTTMFLRPQFHSNPASAAKSSLLPQPENSESMPCSAPTSPAPGQRKRKFED